MSYEPLALFIGAPMLFKSWASVDMSAKTSQSAAGVYVEAIEYCGAKVMIESAIALKVIGCLKGFMINTRSCSGRLD